MHGEDIARWTPRRVAAAAFVIGFLAVQTLLPIRQLTEDRPARFGWQMYSTVLRRPVMLLEDARGMTDTLRVADFSAHWRIELDPVRHVPAHACATRPNAVAVLIIRNDGTPPERLPCRT